MENKNKKEVNSEFVKGRSPTNKYTSIKIWAVKPEEKDRFRAFCNEYAGGQYRAGLIFLMDYYDLFHNLIKGLNMRVERIEKAFDELSYIQDEPEKKEIIETFGGND